MEVAADTSSMISHELELFDAHPQWRPLLEAYQNQHGLGLEWCPRSTPLEGQTDADLSAFHGKLIALGLLKFEIASRADGVHYQVTTLGRQALKPAEARQLVPEWMQAEEPDPVLAASE